MGLEETGLVYPYDLDAWRAWQRNADLVRRVKAQAKSFPFLASPALAEEQEEAVGRLYIRGGNPRVLSVLGSASPTSLSSFIRPLEFMPATDVAIWAPTGVCFELPDGEWEQLTVPESELGRSLPNLAVVLASGHYLVGDAAAYRLASARGAQFVVVQHGLLTPFAPPLPPGSTLLAFSQADADFWISGRTDVSSQVVGSQLFWEAAQQPAPLPAKLHTTPLFLGQMHGAELPRASFAYSSVKFARKNKAIYRPHPSEKDKLSVLTHQLMSRLGIKVDYSQQPLNQMNHPVVSIFSTGVLEAALRGVPSWVYHANPPAWLVEFWERYGMSTWGNAPTPAPQLPYQEPAKTIAHILTQSLEN